MALECRRTRRHSARWLLKPGMKRSAHGPSQIAIWRLHPTPKIAEALRREPKEPYHIATVHNPGVRTWATERFYGGGGEEMAPSSLWLTDGVPRCPSRTT